MQAVTPEYTDSGVTICCTQASESRTDRITYVSVERLNLNGPQVSSPLRRKNKSHIHRKEEVPATFGHITYAQHISSLTKPLSSATSSEAPLLPSPWYQPQKQKQLHAMMVSTILDRKRGQLLFPSRFSRHCSHRVQSNQGTQALRRCTESRQHFS